MAIKRLQLKELENICCEIFYDYMAEGKFYYTCSENVLDLGNRVELKDGVTPVDMLYQETQDTIKENAERIKFLEGIIETFKDNKTLREIHEAQIAVLKEERELFLNSNMQTQKEFYEKTKMAEYSRSIVNIPLDKLINSYYDDLVLQVLFYDNLGVNAGEYDTYEAISDPVARKNFIKANTEITHLGLAIMSENSINSIIALKGNLKPSESSFHSFTPLSKKYANFDKLKLKDTMEISNNDIRQVLQSKIDLDKDDLTLCAEKVVRGDDYKIFKTQDTEDNFGYKVEAFFIRYVCPSTGRVYYNSLNLANLEYSEYFKKDNYSSYIDAWWSLNNLGASVEGDAIIRC